MSETKMSVEEWFNAINHCKEQLQWSDTPLDRSVYQSYEHKDASTRVLALVLRYTSVPLIDELGSRKDVVVLLQMFPSNAHLFLGLNYKEYCGDERPANFIKFHDVMLFSGGEHVFCSKCQINTPVKFKHFVDRLTSSELNKCNICLEEGSDMISCGTCNNTFCRDCNSKWCSTKRLEVSCPTCRAKPSLTLILE